MKKRILFSIATFIALLNSSVLFSQDLGKIFFTSNRSGTHDIWMCNPDGSDQIQLTNKPGEELFPRVSPDGSKILYTYRIASNKSISDPLAVRLLFTVTASSCSTPL